MASDKEAVKFYKDKIGFKKGVLKREVESAKVWKELKSVRGVVLMKMVI